jgi:hypothetical protein
MKEVGEFEIETMMQISTYNPIDFSTRRRKDKWQIFMPKDTRKRAIAWQRMVNDEVEKTGRIALGVNSAR